jgi:hypothetical protein
MGRNGDTNLHMAGNSVQLSGLPAISAPIANIAPAAITVIVPSTLLRRACEQWGVLRPCRA